MSEGVSDREYLEAMIAANERRHADLSAARDKAVDAAFVAAFEKSQMHNGLLAALEKAQDEFVPREQFKIEVAALKEAMSDTKLLVANSTGRATGVNQLLIMLFAVVAATGTILGIFALFKGVTP